MISWIVNFALKCSSFSEKVICDTFQIGSNLPPAALYSSTITSPCFFQFTISQLLLRQKTFHFECFVLMLKWNLCVCCRDKANWPIWGDCLGLYVGLVVLGGTNWKHFAKMEPVGGNWRPVLLQPKIFRGQKVVQSFPPIFCKAAPHSGLKLFLPY